MTDAERLIERLLKVESSKDTGYTGESATNWYRNPDGPEAAALIWQQAERIAELEGALEALLIAARLLMANAEGCAVNHYGDDFSQHGVPGWMADCSRDIERARKALGRL